MATTTTTAAHPLDQLRAEATAARLDLASPQFAAHLDAADPLRALRNDFLLPAYPAPAAGTAAASAHADKVVYLCGNSLGLQPRGTRDLLMQELDVWANRGVMGHFDHPYGPTAAVSLFAPPRFAAALDAARPGGAAWGILLTAPRLPGPPRGGTAAASASCPTKAVYPGRQTVWALQPGGTGELATLRTEDILATIKQHGNEIAVVLFSGVQYYTGQLFDMPTITRAAREAGCVVGWDLAHAVGNVPLHLHDWDVDFAAWCTYKYLNSGPGCIAGAFVHAKHADKKMADLPRFAGWWGHDKQSRFKMPDQFAPMPGAAGFQLSNPSVVATVSLLGSMQVFQKTSIAQLRAKSLRLTAYLEHLLVSEIAPLPSALGLRILTPSDPNQRGAQLSLLFAKMNGVGSLMKELEHRGVVVDEREPNVIRVAPAPIYNNFTDVRRFVTALKESLEAVAAKN
ncbi:kynureninase [Allomyces macrogynus ATCC 38327]|uniref:Kynureninase n=1 Tax=Allomyces macrogynus (strain ATCC 38327) TaxID=578462 RepID=A0A0L0S455_ALLM3|nr:kynureninase [Allomyces macrogynus ATCC 38327]|eukprot:KNE57323.1 kynureninase [Allomyces macrogynus ATCC 38327]